MKIDRFMAQAGLADAAGDLPDEARARMVEWADGFFRAGGALSLDEYHALGAESRGAFAAAWGRLEAERALLRGVAGSGPEGVALVKAAIDGGDALMDSLLTRAVETAAAKLSGRK